jgi:predicted amidohydrolase
MDYLFINYSVGRELMRRTTIPIILIAFTTDRNQNISILEKSPFFEFASELGHSGTKQHSADFVKDLDFVLPVIFLKCCSASHFFKIKNRAFYKSVIIIDSKGWSLDFYRKSPIFGGTGYDEEYYFNPGDNGFSEWKNHKGNIGFGNLLGSVVS